MDLNKLSRVLTSQEEACSHDVLASFKAVPSSMRNRSQVRGQPFAQREMQVRGSSLGSGGKVRVQRLVVVGYRKFDIRSASELKTNYELS
jgi:CRISPR/Cas system-associated exonuclease Cas4 (RecB family)